MEMFIMYNFLPVYEYFYLKALYKCYYNLNQTVCACKYA